MYSGGGAAERPPRPDYKGMLLFYVLFSLSSLIGWMQKIFRCKAGLRQSVEKTSPLEDLTWRHVLVGTVRAYIPCALEQTNVCSDTQCTYWFFFFNEFYGLSQWSAPLTASRILPGPELHCNLALCMGPIEVRLQLKAKIIILSHVWKLCELKPNSRLLITCFA